MAEALIGMLKTQIEHQQQQMEQQRNLHEALIESLKGVAVGSTSIVSSIPSFAPFDQTSELWTDYWERFQTFIGANSVPETKVAQVFLTNQSAVVYKMLQNLASQQQPPKEINKLTIDEIVTFMKDRYDPKRFTIRERFKFWSDMKRRPGETVPELATRIRQDAITCDFTSIKNPLDEALCTRFICSISNEAVLKAIFKLKEDELDFEKAVKTAVEIEDAAKVAKETTYGSKSTEIVQTNVIKQSQNRSSNCKKNGSGSSHAESKGNARCGRCDRLGHTGADCKFKEAVCHYCRKKGHIKPACLLRKKEQTVKTIKLSKAVPLLQQKLQVDDKIYSFEVDTGAGENFISRKRWIELGKPKLEKTNQKYESASGHELKILGIYSSSKVSLPNDNSQTAVKLLKFVVTEVPNLNLLGRDAIVKLEISIDSLIYKNPLKMSVNVIEKSNNSLKNACEKLCLEFPDLFKNELGCLKDVELDINFKPDSKPVFLKHRPVPFAIRDELSQAYDAGIAKGIWKPVKFNDYGTPVVPVRKKCLSGKSSGSIRVCGDYSVTVNPQLETHRQPIPLPEELMQKLGGGCGFTKIDLADAYNQIMLSEESQKRLALSTHRGVLLQMRLPFGISSAPGYFQQIMCQLTADLKGVAVYLDDILVSGVNAEDHLQNLRALLQRLQDKGLRCRREKCSFAQPVVEYLGHRLSKDGIAKSKNVEAVLQMPPPHDVSSLKSFLGSVQFYSKFLPNLSTVTEPLHELTRKDVKWDWDRNRQESFQKLKEMLCSEELLTHFDPTMPIGISCDASNVGIGAVLFHRFPDGSERPIMNVSKTLTATQRKYSQVHKEALAIIFALKKFYQYLYGRKFILVTDHKPLLALFGPTKATPALAANRLARWALTLSQYEYEIEYRSSKKHGNADALSRLPIGCDMNFDQGEEEENRQTVSLIHLISQQIKPTDSEVLVKESAKDPVISSVMRYARDGWPEHAASSNSTNQIYSVEDFKKISESLSVENGCLFYGTRVVIPQNLQKQVLQILHSGHFGMQRMKQLARTAVYWPRMNKDIVDTCHECISCAQQQNEPSKQVNHPWMLPEKPWMRVHIDHAVNFMGTNWLVLVDSYSKYPCIHPANSVSSRETMKLLETDFAHFGYPHTIVSDNSSSFKSEEFQEWCKARGIIHLTGAPYHPATNGAAERLVQSFKQALKKSSLQPKEALQEFLMQYRRTPLSSGISPSELLNGRQIRTKIDILLPSPAHRAQGKQMKETANRPNNSVSKVRNPFKVGTPCYALYYGPRHSQKQPRWVPAVVIKVFGTRSVNVKVHPRGPVWRRHVDQLRPRYGAEEDNDPGNTPSTESCSGLDSNVQNPSPRIKDEPKLSRSPPGSPATYGPGNPRRSKRPWKPRFKMDL